MARTGEGSAGTAIEVKELRRIYQQRSGWLRPSKGEHIALHGIDLDIPVGEVHGLLGPNGAGKSTLCKILATVLVPTSGTARILGHDVVSDKQRVRELLALVLGGERGLYPRLTARQNLRFWASLYGLTEEVANQRADALLDRVSLFDRRNDRVETFSRGMKQRLHLARGLLSDPAVILLDEPTTGMDPIATKDFQALVREIREGRTILLATHDMVEAECLCDRVSIVNGGRIAATETPSTLSTWITRFERIDVATELDEGVADKIRRIDGVGKVTANPDGGTRIETVAEGAAADVLRYLLEQGRIDVRTSMPSLEEVYLHLLGAEQPEAA